VNSIRRARRNKQALQVIAVKKADVAEKQQKDREDGNVTVWAAW